MSTLWLVQTRLNCWFVRAIVRAMVSIPIGGLAGMIAQLRDDAEHHPQAADLIITAVLAAMIIWLLRWIGRDHGGILGAIKICLLSFGFTQSLVIGADTLWRALGMDGPPVWPVLGLTAALSFALFLPTAVVLCRIDPD
jgi:hypothetical protein